MTFDPIDLKLIALLEADARISFADLAEQVALSKTPCWNRVKALEEAGVIRGYGARLDTTALGFDLEAFVQISIDIEQSHAFEAAVQRHPLIRSCHATTGEADYLLHIMASDMVALDDLLREAISRLPGVKRTVTSMSTRAIKTHVSLAAAHKARTKFT